MSKVVIAPVTVIPLVDLDNHTVEAG